MTILTPIKTLRTARADFLVQYLDLEAATGYPRARWENFQLAHLQDDNTFRCEVKSRQIAWSWLSAAEAVADGILYGTGSVFVSINLDEAKEKIRYAKNIVEALPADRRPTYDTDNRTELEFNNGARLLSLPATAPRGKAQMNVYLDEFAHVQDARIIYTAALPMITKGDRRLRIASSPMGASGTFWEVYTQSLRAYTGYRRKATPWWEIFAFSRNAKEAYRVAPGMTTEERVGEYGNERIQAICENMPIDDFQQEYECLFVNENSAWITWEEIRAAQTNPLCYQAATRLTVVPEIFEAVNAVREAIDRGLIEQALAGGLDIGRKRNTSELYLVGIGPTDQYPLRLTLSLDALSYDDQLSVVTYVMDNLPVVSLMIDQTGIGNNIAESAAKLHPVKVQPVTFTMALKKVWATDAKQLIQQRRTPLPTDKDLAYQIHSIKKIITPSNNVSFDTTKNEKHHADKFWAWALALAGAYHSRTVGTVASSSSISREQLLTVFGEGVRDGSRSEYDHRLGKIGDTEVNPEWRQLENYDQWSNRG